MENLDNEIWKDIKGYEGLYQISNLGNVKSLERIVKRKESNYKNSSSHCRIKEKILKPSNVRGYNMVELCKNGLIKHFKNHRLVASAFIEDIPNGKVVNHKNAIKTDNRLENLEIVTELENITHGINRIKTSSKFSGVSWNKIKQKWVAYYYINRKQIHIGYFENEIEAANAYKIKMLEIKRQNKYTVLI